MNTINALVAAQGGYSPSFYRVQFPFGTLTYRPNPNFSTIPERRPLPVIF